MMSIQFVGDLPLWAGLTLALGLSLGVWWLYRRERHDLPGRLRHWLPVLRAAVVFITILTLTGPVVHHRRISGQLGRLLVVVDASQSMQTADQHMSVARKLLIAQQLGWIPADLVDPTVWRLCDRLSSARLAAQALLQEDSPSAPAVAQCRRELERAVQEVGGGIDQYDWQQHFGSSSAGSTPPPWYEQLVRFREAVGVRTTSASHTGEASTDASASALEDLRDLLNMTAPCQQALEQALEAYGAQLYHSGNPDILSALALFDQTSRWRRAEERLLKDDGGLLSAWSRRHEVEVMGLEGTRLVPLWNSAASGEVPAAFSLTADAAATNLGQSLLAGVASRFSRSQDSGAEAAGVPRTAIVLLTDGQHNTGPSPLQAARLLGSQRVPMFCVGYGATREPPDLALAGVEHPDLVFRKDHLRGTILLKDRMPPGQPLLIQIQHGSDTVWQQELTTQDVDVRRIEFAFPVEPLVDQLSAESDRSVRHHALPVHLTVSIPPVEGETETSNNSLPLRFQVITQSYKLLLLDGRPRWETRYVRNLFQRDDQWEIHTILVGPGTDHQTLPRGTEPDQFPADRSSLFDYDVILLGEIPPGVLTDYEQRWIRQFVEVRGGGLILLDGARGCLHQLDEPVFGPLLPVQRRAESMAGRTQRLRLTDAGANLEALRLEPTRAANERLWREFPPPHQVVPVKALPGTETLAEVDLPGGKLPALVTRPFGAGRVLYFAFDETWRWRYQVADRYHQRFWNQIVKWVMARPYAVSDDFVSLDSGPLHYRAGQSAEIRVQLRGLDGKPVNEATVDAVLQRDGRAVSTVSLIQDTAGQGRYHGQTGPLEPGEYTVRVRASGFSEEAFKARSRFVVEPPANAELQQVACREDLLRQMARLSGGRFLREENGAQLNALLEPLSHGTVIESETLIWQSYWWFGAIVLLLAVEWALRKRSGLL